MIDDPNADRDALAQAVARKDAWAWVLHDPRGRFVLAELLRNAAPLHGSHTPGDPYGTAFREGQRSLGVLIYAAVMDALPSAWAHLHDVVMGRDERG